MDRETPDPQIGINNIPQSNFSIGNFQSDSLHNNINSNREDFNNQNLIPDLTKDKIINKSNFNQQNRFSKFCK